MKPRTRQYVVTWQLGAIVASSPREAAEAAVEAMRSGRVCRFTVEWTEHRGRYRQSGTGGKYRREDIDVDVHELQRAVAPAVLRVGMTSRVVEWIADPRLTVWEYRSPSSGQVRFRVWRNPETSKLVLTDFRRPGDARSWRLVYEVRRPASGRVLVHVEKHAFYAVPNSHWAEIEKAICLTESA